MLRSSSAAIGRRRRGSRRAPDQEISLTSLQLVEQAARAAADKKALDVVVLFVGDFLQITDHFLICHGLNDRQVRTIADAIERRLRELGARPLRREGEREGRWILLDYGPFVVHVFGEPDREFYDLERLWKDAPRVDVLPPQEAVG